MSSEASYVHGKQHPWLRFWNAFGRVIGNRELPWTTLDPERLMTKARRKVDGREFASREFLESMQPILAGTKPHYNYVGSVLAHAMAVLNLQERLLRERLVEDHPEILEQPIKRPLIVVGAPRTGTTLLNFLLSQDAASRPLLGWESLFASPRKRRVKRGEVPKTLLQLMSFNERMFKRILPDLARMHPFAHDQPDECHWLLFPSFVWVPAIAAPGMRRWFIEQSDETYDRAYRDYRLALQILEWQRPAEDHWVLKSPLHFWSLGSAMRTLPEANFVQTHRSLLKVFPSFCSLAAALIAVLSDQLEPKRMGPAAMEIGQAALERFDRAREEDTQGRVEDVLFTDLVKDPVAVIRKIYDRFDYEFTPEFERRIHAFLAEQKKAGGVPKHRYTVEQFGLDADAIRETFAPYHERYGIDVDA
jgi:hypothetical protein